MATVVYATPHQDDETLSMGASIRRHIEAGHQVHVLLLTDGVNSAARAQTGLTRVAFGRARDDEYRRACRALGVAWEHIHISRHSTEDGLLTGVAVEDSLRWFLDRHPGAWVKTYSHLTASGRHGDHVAAGQGAMALLSQGVIDNLRLYIEPWTLDQFRAAYPATALGQDTAASTAAVRAALDEYKVVDRIGGKYGIGYLSVPTFVDQVRANPVSYYHAP